MLREPDQTEEAPLRRLLNALPGPVQRAIAWLRRPGLIWLRVPIALLFLFGGFLGFLPILGFWMAPLGLLLLADDVPFLRRPTLRALGVYVADSSCSPAPALAAAFSPSPPAATFFEATACALSSAALPFWAKSCSARWI